ncbi:Coenzyme F420 hydrogenase/dehydrogenase, beta subunit C-terminal domain [Desulfosarcina sp. OttesenSCG-928-A07]|nr:Coenzyme F420 hydrogenase/dehydrogenase, beta subunit C-terminal domain [Desulfosarcina sp. OttesenSCG-928-G17]MDL2328206.1 Coenzyme F420 hydrogenase/dehydrogenase, beta subunit C-terminal domain [Desulfosarcina sp. OttesenSCG-928-A07]
MVAEFNLKRDVLQKGLCTLCGACMDGCPYLKNIADHLVMPFQCSAGEGRCLAVCPCLPTDWEDVRKRFLGDSAADPDIGVIAGVYKVRAKHPISRCQNGGTVSALLAYGMDAGLGESALLTRSSGGLEPEPFWAKSPEDIQEAAGSKYFAAGSLRLLNDRHRQWDKPVMVVGRPCQIRALRKIQIHEQSTGHTSPVLSIGLFCTWQLSWSFGDFLAQEFPGKKVQRIAISLQGLEVDFGEGPQPVSMDGVRAHMRSACHYCLDMTAELADIAVGAFEQEAGWNTLIVRSKAGMDWFEGAKNRGDLLVAAYPEAELQRLKAAAHNKARRGLEKIRSEAV